MNNSVKDTAARYGLPVATIKNMEKVFEQMQGVDRVILFGSRAKGNFKPGSDIDLAVKGDVTFKDVLRLGAKLDALNLPYKIDLLDYKSIKEPALIEHIDRVGIEFYSRWKKYNFSDFVTIHNR